MSPARISEEPGAAATAIRIRSIRIGLHPCANPHIRSAEKQHRERDQSEQASARKRCLNTSYDIDIISLNDTDITHTVKNFLRNGPAQRSRAASLDDAAAVEGWENRGWLQPLA
jgi:hypothetical protein